MQVEISEKAEKLLYKKAMDNNMTMTQMLNHMIMSFSPSTDAEIKMQMLCKNYLRDSYFEEHPKTNRFKTWGAGYSAGWFLFQVRKEVTLENLIVQFGRYNKNAASYVQNLKDRGILPKEK